MKDREQEQDVGASRVDSVETRIFLGGQQDCFNLHLFSVVQIIINQIMPFVHADLHLQVMSPSYEHGELSGSLVCRSTFALSIL